MGRGSAASWRLGLLPAIPSVSQVYVLKRPYVDEFLRRMGELFECVLFTASLAKVPDCRREGGAGDRVGPSTPRLKLLSFFQYADPVTDLLDRCGVFRARLFRESCVFHQGCYVKDLSRLGRDLRKTVILDNSPASYIFHPENAVSAPDQGRGGAGRGPQAGTVGSIRSPLPLCGPAASSGTGNRRKSQIMSLSLPQVPVQSWFDDMADTELLNLIPVFEELSGADDVYTSLGQLRAP